MTDLQKEISTAVKAKKLVAGAKETVKALLTADVKLVAVSERANTLLKNTLKYYSALAGVPCEMVPKNTIELGSMCGKPYSVSAFAVLGKK
ncbi:MAG: ribosomal L7Ae/L30e/S12e/Gadd45 family protein [Candidatus Altiarchaeota archaeon]